MDPHTAEKKPVRVTIFHQPYTLLASDPDALQELADSVDELMAAIAARAPNADALRVAVLACLHLADRLRSLEREIGDLRHRVDQKTEQFRLLLEQAIDETGPQPPESPPSGPRS
jgi:cell division protein ZapA